MQKEKLEFLKEKAAELRKDVITMIYEAQSGHPGGSLSAADFVAALYFSEMKVDPKTRNGPTETASCCQKDTHVRYSMRRLQNSDFSISRF